MMDDGHPISIINCYACRFFHLFWSIASQTKCLLCGRQMHLARVSPKKWTLLYIISRQDNSLATDLSRFMALILYVSWKGSCLLVRLS